MANKTTDDRSERVSRVAADVFSIPAPLPYQRLVIDSILAAWEMVSSDGASPAGDELDVIHEYAQRIVVLPTGAGKSLCFQLPIVLGVRPTLVVYPLLSLISDQVRRFAAYGIRAAVLKGNQTRTERAGIARRIGAGEIDCILTNPETLASDAVRSLVRSAHIAHAVIDEAHCISEWGDTFRPAYLTLGESLAAIGATVRTAFTATASDHAIARIREVAFADGRGQVVRANPDRPNITYAVQPVGSVSHALRTLLGSARTGSHAALTVWRPGSTLALPAIVFCRTRAETEYVQALLSPLLGATRTFAYHAGMSVEVKNRTEAAFFSHDNAVLAATCAYGMGVDKPNVRTVVHTYLPRTAESFLQESGRAGRDRSPAQSIVLVPPDERVRYRRAQEEQSVDVVQAALLGKTCRRAPLLEAMGSDDHFCAGCDTCAADAAAASAAAGAAAAGGSPVGPGPAATASTAAGAAAAPGPAAEAGERLLAMLRRVPYRLTPRELTRMLSGRLSAHDTLRGSWRHPASGLLHSWTVQECGELIDGLIAEGHLAVRNGQIRPTRT